MTEDKTCTMVIEVAMNEKKKINKKMLIRDKLFLPEILKCPYKQSIPKRFEHINFYQKGAKNQVQQR